MGPTPPVTTIPPDTTGTDCNPEDPTCDTSGGTPVGGPGGIDIGPNPLPGTTGDTGTSTVTSGTGSGEGGTTTESGSGSPPPETVPVTTPPNPPPPVVTNPLPPPERTVTSPFPIRLPPVIAVPPPITTPVTRPFAPVIPTRGPTLGQNSGVTTPPIIDITNPAPIINVTEALSPTPVTVIVNNLETIGADVVSTVSSAINQGIQGIESSFASAMQQWFDGIDSAVKGFAGTIGTAITDALKAVASHIGDILDAVGRGIAKIASDVANAIAPILKDIGGVIKRAAASIANAVGKFLSDFGYILNKYIVPLANAVTRTLAIVRSTITAIQQDIHQGIKGYLAIPGQIADAMQGLDGTLYRLWQQIRPDLKQDTHSNIDYGAAKGLETWSGAIKTGVQDAQRDYQISLQVGNQDYLNDPKIGNIGAAVSTCLTDIVKRSLSTWKDTLQKNVRPGEVSEGSIEGYVKYIFDEFFNLLVGALSAAGVAYPIIAYARQQANKCIPIETLGQGDIAEAFKRGLVDRPTFNEELRRGGLDETRANLVADLTGHLPTADDLVDFSARGIISDSDFEANLHRLGYSTDQIAAEKAASERIPSVDEILHWLRRGVITQDTATALLGNLRYSPQNSQKILGTYQQFVPAKSRMDIDGLLQSSGAGWLRDSMSDPVPQDAQQAAIRDGLEDGYTRLLWLNHWNLPPYNTLVESYFRGLRTAPEVVAHMTALNIPDELHDELIQNARPLIPYRSIPSFVKAGAMSVSDATTELRRHGFDAEHIVWIERLLTATKATATASGAATAHTLSLANARALFDQGAITADQYESILVEHGYTQALAKTAAAAEMMASHIRARKQLIADETAEVLAGVTTIQDATSVLTNAGATQAEIARFHIAATRGLRQTQKNPTEAELVKFAKAHLITQTQYRAALVAQNWPQNWVDAFAALIYPSNTADYPA